MNRNGNTSRHTHLTIMLCITVALLEGLDLQSVGIAAPGIAKEFALSKVQVGWMFSAGLLGLLPGALVGGWLADRLGRKTILIVSVLLFGLFSLATAWVGDFYSLLFSRLVTGLGLGAALPILIALSSEAADAGSRSIAVSLTYCGVPLGGGIASIIGMMEWGHGWRTVFYVGGIMPIVVALLLVVCLPESQAFRQRQQENQTTVAKPIGITGLFRQGLWRSTLLLWLSSFFTLIVLYMLLNWLPSLLLERGFSRSQSGIVQIVFNLGGATGSLLTGRMMDRSRPALAIWIAYIGLLLSLAGLGLAYSFLLILLAGFVAGYCTIGGQLVLYALAPTLYPTAIRATGVGAAVSIGRLGSIGGPLIAGQILAAGAGVGGVLLAVSPGLIIAALAARALLGKRPTAPREHPSPASISP